MIMDEYDVLFELMAQPSRYSAEEIEELLSSGDMREVYNLLCMAGGAVASNGEDADVDAEWMAFARRHSGGGLRELWRSRRVAAIAAIACTSVAAVAIGIAIGVSSLERGEAPAEVPAKGLAMAAVAEGTEVLADKGEMDDFSEPILLRMRRLRESCGAWGKGMAWRWSTRGRRPVSCIYITGLTRACL